MIYIHLVELNQQNLSNCAPAFLTLRQGQKESLALACLGPRCLEQAGTSLLVIYCILYKDTGQDIDQFNVSNITIVHTIIIFLQLKDDMSAYEL